MTRYCYICGDEFQKDELVELTVVAPWNPLKSSVTFSIGRPVDAYADTLRHNKCPNGSNDEYQV